MFRFIFFVIGFFISSISFAQTFSLPSTSSTGIYSISYSHSGIGVTLIDELVGGSWQNIGGGGTNGVVNVTKTQNGVYSYRARTCVSSCNTPSATKTITVTIVPAAPMLSVTGLENASANIDTNGTFSFSWPAVANAETYALERNGGVVYYDTSTAYNTVSLGFGTYTFRVKACRTNATVCSGYSNAITITIQYPQPAMPSGPTFSGLENAATNTDSNGTFAISWGESVGAEAYLLQRNGIDLYWGTNRTHSESGLQPGAYSYKVRGCRDSATNCSSFTATQTITVVVPAPSSSSVASSSIALTSSSRSSSSITLASSSRSSSSIALASSSRSSSSIAPASSSRSSSSAALISSSRSSSSVAVISSSRSSSSSSTASAQTTITTYVYDDLGRIYTVTHPNAVKNTYTYDAADNRTKKESTAN